MRKIVEVDTACDYCGETALDASELQYRDVVNMLYSERDCHPLGLVGSSSAIKNIREFIYKVADSESTVVISGESGTGKEVVAKAIHSRSSRARYPFVPVNCAAIPKDLLEPEFFGHEKGAFTGAVNAKAGRFELANGGTIFLDEVGELHISLQAKLLRVVQEREFERVGGGRTIRINVRILAATNRDLAKAVQEGSFREDLFYRLNVIPVYMPPLRDRSDDIPLLVEHFLLKLSKKRKKGLIRIHRDAMHCLMDYRWPGNVREMENLIERIIILSDTETITAEMLWLRPCKKQHGAEPFGPLRFFYPIFGGPACEGARRVLRPSHCKGLIHHPPRAVPDKPAALRGMSIPWRSTRRTREGSE